MTIIKLLLSTYLLCLCYINFINCNPDVDSAFNAEVFNDKYEDNDLINILKNDLTVGKTLYVYRTPQGLFIDETAIPQSDNNIKRSMNKFKNMMLNKDTIEQILEPNEEIKEQSGHFYFPRISTKRVPGAILSWTMPAVNHVKVLNTSYRPIGINRPAA